MSRPLELRQILSLQFYLYFTILGVLLFFFFFFVRFVCSFVLFCLIRFICSLLSTTPDSSKMEDWEGDERG